MAFTDPVTLDGRLATLVPLSHAQHRELDEAVRDTCVYSILDREWPTVRRHLAYQLSKPRR